MKTSFVVRFKRNLLIAPKLGSLMILCAGMGLPSIAFAGVLVTKANLAEVGTIVVTETEVSLQSQYGAVSYKKDALLWYSADAAVDSLYKAAQKAGQEGNTAAAVALYGLSIAKEPATKEQAKAELDTLKQSAVGLATQKVEVPTSIAPEMTPEEKIARGQQLIDGAKTVESQQFLNEGSRNAAMEVAKKNMDDGKRLVAKGKAEAAAAKVKLDADLAAEAEKRREAEEARAQVHQLQEQLTTHSEWSSQDKLVNAGAAAVFALVVLVALWQIVMKEA